MSMNKSILIGRTTKDPELRYSNNGVAICNFTLAVNRTFDKDNADFIRTVCFKKTAENVANYVGRGSQVAVEGRIQTRNYENREGNKVYVTEVVAENVQFLDTRGSGEGNGSASQSNSAPKDNNATEDGNPIDINDDDLPF